MKGYKLPFNDKFGNPLHEGDRFRYTAHKGYSLPNFEGQIVWIEEYAAFGYKKSGPIHGFAATTPFTAHHELKKDFLSHIERIEP